MCVFGLIDDDVAASIPKNTHMETNMIMDFEKWSHQNVKHIYAALEFNHSIAARNSPTNCHFIFIELDDFILFRFLWLFYM